MSGRRDLTRIALASLGADRRAAGSWRIAYAALDLARMVAEAPRAALYACEGDALRLLALRGAEAFVEPLLRVWSNEHTRLVRGHPYAHREPAFVALPCVDGTTVMGVLVLAWAEGLASVEVAGALAPLGRTLGAVLGRLGTPGGNVLSDVARVPVACRTLDTRALPLHTLLDEHEWNVARVARALGVTRMTVYNRMAAVGLPRLRIVKTRPRKRQPKQGMRP